MFSSEFVTTVTLFFKVFDIRKLLYLILLYLTTGEH